MLRKLSTVTGLLLASTLCLADVDQYKIHIDPTMALAGYANVQLDRRVTSDLTAGVMVWHQDAASWSSSGLAQTSVGMRVDWFEQDAFASGWHTNAMVKVDLDNGRYARSRLKFTQTYQLARQDVYFNLGIGVQFVAESDQAENDLYEYLSWMLPAWEFSVSRSF